MFDVTQTKNFLTTNSNSKNKQSRKKRKIYTLLNKLKSFMIQNISMDCNVCGKIFTPIANNFEVNYTFELCSRKL